MVWIVEGVHVLIRGRRRDTTADHPQSECGEQESDRWTDDPEPQRSLEHRVEGDIDEELESTDEQPGDDAGDGGEQHHLARPSDEIADLVAPPGEGIGPDPTHHTVVDESTERHATLGTAVAPAPAGIDSRVSGRCGWRR